MHFNQATFRWPIADELTRTAALDPVRSLMTGSIVVMKASISI
jgi:hypothetical protein